MAGFIRRCAKGVANFCRSVAHMFRKGVKWFSIVTLRDGNRATDKKPSYTHCKNCGAELQGMYCHKCGQEAVTGLPKMWVFFMEYINHISCIEKLTLPTLSNLIFHPGHLAKEYCAGRHTSYMHPLKLNFFILILLFALFSFTETDTRVKGALSFLSDDETFVGDFTLSNISDNAEYMAQVKNSSRDTVQIVASYNVVNNYHAIMDVVDIKGVDDDGSMDTLLVSVPRVMIDDGYLVQREDSKDDSYHFSLDAEDELVVGEINTLWSQLTSLFFGHFPLLMLLTAPFLAASIRFTLRHRKYPKTYFYISALYYLAFVALTFLVFYILGMIFDFSFSSVELPLLLLLFTYLTIALKKTYDISTWFRAALAATFVNLTYLIICVLHLILLSFVILFIIIAIDSYNATM